MKFLSNGGEMNDPVKNIHFNSKHVGKMRDFLVKILCPVMSMG